MIGICFGGSATENSKLSPATFRRPAFETLKSAAEGTDWPLSPIWIGEYPINVLLCQLESDLRVGLDIYPQLE